MIVIAIATIMSIEYLVLHYITEWVQDWIRYIRNKPRTTIQPPVEPAAETVETQNPDFPLDSKAELFASNVWTEEVVILNHEIPEDVFGSENADGKPSGIKEEINVLHNCGLFQVEEAVLSPNCPVLQANHDTHVMTGIDLISSPKETVASDLIVWQSSRQRSTSSQTTTNRENENDWFKDGPDGREWHPLIPGLAILLVLAIFGFFFACCTTCLCRSSRFDREKRRLRREVLELREELARQKNLFQQQNGMLEEQRALLERAEEEKRTLQAKKAEDAVAKAAFIAELKAEVVDKAKQAEAAQANDAQKEAVIANLEASLASAKKEIEELQATAVASDIKEKAQESALETLETSVALKEEQIKDLQEELNALEEANKAAEAAVVSLKAQVEAKDAKIAQQKKYLATAEASAINQANELEKHQGNLAALEVSKEVLIKEHKEAVAVLEASLEAKDKAAQLALKAKEAEIEEHKVARAALEAAIKKKEDEVKDQATTLAGLETSLHLKEDELRQVQSMLDALMTEKEDAARGNQAKVSLLEKELTMVKKAMEEAKKEVQSAKEALANEIKGQLNAFGALEEVVDSKNLEINELKEAMASQRSQIEGLQQLVKKAEAARVEEMEKREAAEKACQEEQEEREEEDDDDWETVDEEEDDEPQTAVASPTWGPESEGATFSQTRTDCLTEPEVATPVVAMVFSEELDSSFTTTAATAEGALPSPEDTPRVNINLEAFGAVVAGEEESISPEDIPLPASPVQEAESPSVNGTGSASVSPAPAPPALITSVATDKDHIFTEVKVKKGKFGPGALLQSKWATPTTPTTPTTPAPAPAATTSAATPAPVSLPSATQDSPNSLFDPTPTPAKAEQQVVKKTPGTLMTSKWASAAAAAAAPSPLATATPLVPTSDSSSPAPSTPSKRPEEAKGKEKDHIFYEVKVKKGGAGPGQILLSKWATPPAATPAAAPASAPTRPKTKVERIASQNAERGLPESTPNRPKTKAEREAGDK
ncbi:hypothetical protein HRR94_001294 [Exophiala dermatitidis]|nr:hypothetical protein HRR79_003301 [Exophiala dermatitidis]KAJ4650102.1 hypothetical protein HRR89_000178 [Exophiala dermatitidis]KAJ9003952.1 hypothetical protein HRR94_001294 [Exophiala dermatitidis]